VPLALELLYLEQLEEESQGEEMANPFVHRPVLLAILQVNRAGLPAKWPTRQDETGRWITL